MMSLALVPSKEVITSEESLITVEFLYQVHLHDWSDVLSTATNSASSFSFRACKFHNNIDIMMTNSHALNSII